MKTILAALALLFALLAGHDHAKAADVRAMTFNIRLDLASDGANAWPHRRQMVASILRFHAPDIAGLQEVLLHQKQNLESDLPQYAVVGVARDDGISKGEFSPIFYRRDRFTVQGSGTFWLSPTSEKPSVGWDAALPRVATWVRLRDRKSGKRVLAVNTHFDHKGEEARRQSALLILFWLNEHRKKGERLVLLGDFNANADSAPYQAILASKKPLFADSRSLTKTAPFGPALTFTAFKIEASEGKAIDHIFVEPKTTVLRYGVITQQEGGRLPSDHYPVIADLRL